MTTKEKRVEGDIKRLYTENVTKRLFSLFYKGRSIKDIARRCGVVEDAVKKAFPTLDFGKRCKIVFHKKKD